MVEAILMGTVFRFKVMHSMPGRFRVHIPMAKKVPDKWQIDVNGLDIFKKIHGVTAVDFSYVTGNALIHYDPGKTDEKTIVATAKRVMVELSKRRKEFDHYTHLDKEKATAHVVAIVDDCLGTTVDDSRKKEGV